MKFRKADEKDAKAVCEIYKCAKLLLKNSNIPQWQGNDPGPATFAEHVKAGSCYVLEENGIVLATVQIIPNEPYYQTLSGGKFEDDNAVVAHRFAVSDKILRHGVGSELISQCCKTAVSFGKTSIRLDTHKLNFRMRNLLTKNGFRQVGNVILPTGEERIVFEKIL